MCFPLENRGSSPVPTALFYIRSPSFSFRASEGAFSSAVQQEREFLLLSRLCPRLGGVDPRAAPCPRSRWLCKGALSRTTAWPWLRPWPQDSERDGDTRDVGRAAGGPVGTSSRGGPQKIQEPQLGQPSPEPASCSFYIISVQGAQTQSDLGCDRGVPGEAQEVLPLPLLLDCPPWDRRTGSLRPTTATSSPGLYQQRCSPA